MTVSHGQDPRIPLPVVAQALRELIYTDSLIPHSVGESQRSWSVAGSCPLTFVEVGKQYGTRYITNEAEMLMTIAFLINENHSKELYLDSTLCWFLSALRFTNCQRPEHILEKLAAIKVQMVFGNISYVFQLIRIARTPNNIPYFEIGPELMSACGDIFTDCDLMSHYELSQPLPRRISRALSRKDLLLNIPYTAARLSQALKLYTSAVPAAAYSIAPIPMDQVRERLFRAERELKQVGFISGIREEKVGDRAALTFLPGWRPIPEWN